MNEKEKPQKGKSIFFSVVAIIAFYISYFVVLMILGLVFTLLLRIPIISSLLSFLFRVRGDTPDIVCWLVATIAAYQATVWMLHRFHDSEVSENLSLKITGIILIVLNIVFLIVNIISGSPFFPNICVGVAGFCMFRRGNPFDP